MNKAWHLTAWGLVNALFLVKYGERVHPLLPLAGAVLVLVGLGMNAAMARFLEKRGRDGLLPWLYLAILLSGSIACFHRIPVASLRVDRFDMIDLFWENFRAGTNPYTPRIAGVSSVPSQFPVYFLLALPFQLIGEIGWIPVVSVAAMGWILWRMPAPFSRRAQVLSLVLLSPALWWEIACRSTIFANSILCLVALLPILRSPRKAPSLKAALFLGLATSTRSVTLQMVLPVVLAKVHRNLRSWIAPALAWLCLPLASIAPLLLLRRFHLWNPFDVNGLFLPGWVSASILLASIAAARLRSDWRWVLSSMVLGLDLLVAIYAGIIIWNVGWSSAFLASGVDISYFLLGSPFHLLLLADSYSPISSGPCTDPLSSLSDQ